MLRCSLSYTKIKRNAKYTKKLFSIFFPKTNFYKIPIGDNLELYYVKIVIKMKTKIKRAKKFRHASLTYIAVRQLFEYISQPHGSFIHLFHTFKFQECSRAIGILYTIKYSCHSFSTINPGTYHHTYLI